MAFTHLSTPLPRTPSRAVSAGLGGSETLAWALTGPVGLGLPVGRPPLPPSSLVPEMKRDFELRRLCIFVRNRIAVPTVGCWPRRGTADSASDAPFCAGPHKGREK